jgi:rare lipoprotein A
MSVFRCLPMSALAAVSFLFSSCQSFQSVSQAKPAPTAVPATPAAKTSSSVVAQQTGIASIYTDYRTASGEPYRAGAMAAAHKTWPLGSRVRVVNLRNGQSTTVRINDRGPYIKGRIIDLTPAAATRIGLSKRQGIVPVRIERLASVRS